MSIDFLKKQLNAYQGRTGEAGLAKATFNDSAAPSISNLSNPTHRRLTPTRSAILHLLVEYRFLTTNDVHKELLYRQLVHANYDARQARRDLESLELLKLVRSFAVEPDMGNRSRHCWLLTSKGATAVNFIKYNQHYRREPSRDVVDFQEMKLELVRLVGTMTAALAGGRGGNCWQLIKPQIYNSRNPLPAFTEQTRPLTQAIRWAEYHAIQELQTSDPQHPLLNEKWERYHSRLYEARVPQHANDYLAHRQSNDGSFVQAVVLILCDPTAGPLFWRNRIKLYGPLASLIPTFGVFKSEAQARAYKPMLKEAGFRLTTLDKVGRLLVQLQK